MRFLSRTVARIKGIEFTLQYIGAWNFAAVAVADNGQPDPCNVNDLLGSRSTVNAVSPKLGGVLPRNPPTAVCTRLETSMGRPMLLKERNVSRP